MNIQAWDIWLIRSLQNSEEWFGQVMEFITALGYPQAYMVLVAMVYWSLDRKIGVRLALFLTIVSSLNSILKMAFHAPRPYWVSREIKAFHASMGFGMPSGHAQSSTGWLLASSYFHRKWFWILAMLLTFLIGLSRPFLGVHFPTQVIAGWAIGMAIMACFLKFEEPVTTWFLKLTFSRQLLFVLGLTALIALAGAISLVFTARWEMPADWARNAAPYLVLDRTLLRSYSLGALAGNAGGFLGVGMGAILMDRMGGFETIGSWWIRLVRIIIGLACMFLLYVGLRKTMPGEMSTIAYATWRFMGFYLISFLAVYLIPVMLIRLGFLRSGRSSEQADDELISH
jgi:membrane-associated phospholipid phosphatase